MLRAAAGRYLLSPSQLFTVSTMATSQNDSNPLPILSPPALLTV